MKKSPRLNQERNLHIVYYSKSNALVYCDVRGQQGTFSTEENILWIMDLYFGQKRLFNIKTS